MAIHGIILIQICFNVPSVSTFTEYIFIIELIYLFIIRLKFIKLFDVVVSA